ncbi:MAG: hypothetical protein PHQ35_04575 [Phycisphaerae bacterium]|nr:hypothetical protein [Phycisphaerae bacterium]
MTEIKKTLAILKVRWPEVVLIIGAGLLIIISSRLLTALRPKSIRTVSLVIPFLSVLFLLIQTLLRCGFLRTVYLECSKRQSLLVLLRTGMRFLWRMFVLHLIYSLPFMLSFLLLSKLVYKYIIPSNTMSPHIVFLFNTLYPVCISLALIKLILLIPALIIVLGCTVFDSFKLFRRYKLSDAKELVLLYFANIAIGLLGSILSHCFWGATCSTAQSQYILRTGFFLVTYFINLMIAVMAVRFVASQNLVFDNHEPSNDLNFEDLQKYTNRNYKE